MSSTQPVYLIAVLTAKEGKIEQVRALLISSLLPTVRTDYRLLSHNQIIEAMKTLSDEVYRSESNILRYFSYQTKNKQGLDQIVFV